MKLELLLVEEQDFSQYRLDMQEAFQMGAVEGGFAADDVQISYCGVF